MEGKMILKNNGMRSGLWAVGREAVLAVDSKAKGDLRE